MRKKKGKGKEKRGKGKKEKGEVIISEKLLDLINILCFSQELKDGILYGFSVFLRGE